MGEADLFRSLFDAAPDAMIVVDRQGRIVLTNPQAERLFGYAPGELAGNLV
jgi:PAS domain S-box-containing protein